MVRVIGRLAAIGLAIEQSSASSTLTSTGVNVTDNDTATIGSTVYRFKNTLAAAYDVKIGASAAATLANLKAAINASGTPGTEYFAGTVIHPTVSAGAITATTLVITAKTAGPGGNSIATTDTATTLSFTGSTLAGGGTVTRGTGTAPTNWAPVQSLDFDDKVEYLDNDSAYGRIEEINDSEVHKRWAEGGYEGKVFDKTLGVELYALSGQKPVSTQRGVSGVYDHVFSVLNSNQHGSLSISFKDANEDLRFILAMMDSFELSADLDKFLTRKVGFMSKASSGSAGNTVIYTQENEFMASHLGLYLADTYAGLDAASVTRITAFTLTVSKNVEVLYTFGADDVATNAARIDDIINQQFQVEGNFEAYRDDTTLRTKVMAGTKQALRFQATNTAVTIGGSHNPALRADLPLVALQNHERAWDANTATKQTISFKGIFSFTDLALLIMRLTNTQVQY